MPGPPTTFVPPFRELYVRTADDLGGALIGYGLRKEFEKEGSPYPA